MPLFRRKNRLLINIAFFTALLLLATIFYFTYRTEKQRQISTNWLIHTHEVITRSEELNSLIKDAQRAQRGYLLIRDGEDLARYQKAKETIGGKIENLRKLTSYQPAQQVRLYNVRKLSQKALSYWDETIALYHQQGIDASLSMVSRGIGRELVDEISKHINEFKAYEEVLLKERQAQFQESKKLSNLMETVGAFVSLLLITLSFLLLRNRLNREKALSHSLEEMVLQRTKELQRSNEDLKARTQELQQKMHELQLINNDLDNFVYTASHDLRSPILNLKGLHELFASKIQDKLTEKDKLILGRMDESVARLNRTIKDLSEVAKIQKEEHSNELLSFNEILQEVMLEMSPMIHESKAQIQADFNVEYIRYPYSHLKSILYNLLSNAIKYASPDRAPFILISTRAEEGKLKLTVSDNGLGLAPDQLNKLFLMFKRLHNHVEGSGIGLYMIKRIIERNGGSIAVDSKPGIGTSFYVYLTSLAETEAAVV